MAFLGREKPLVTVPAADVSLCALSSTCYLLLAGHVTINILPDDVFLHIFLMIRQECGGSILFLIGMTDHDRVQRLAWRWHRLAHVCRRWRSVVFASPNFLDLILLCGPTTPIELTGIWPPLPIIITNGFGPHMRTSGDVMPEDYDFDAAIVHPNRIREIHLFNLTRSLLQRLASATLMQDQCPALTHLVLQLDPDSHPSSALPDGFLGGSAPLLQSLGLGAIPFPALPKLLLSATHLVHLILQDIPHSGYFSPEAIVTGLGGMTNLESLLIRFKSPLSRPHQESRHPLPPTRTVLPALTRYEFKGASEYLEDFVVRVDAPLLDSIYITFFHQLIFDIPRLAQFMGRTTRFQELKEAHVQFDHYGVQVDTLPPTRTFDGNSGLRISCRELDWQLSSMAQVVTSFIPSIYMVQHLYIYGPRYQWQYDMENMEWLELFHPFTEVKNFYFSWESAPYIAFALEELVGGRTMEVLPILQNLFLEGREPSGPIPEGVEKFVAARQLSNYTITVSRWKRT